MSDRKKVTLPVLFDKMAKGTPLTMITCYDYPTAYLSGAGRHRDRSWSATAWA